MNKKKICCVFNYNPLYRYPIYHEMDEQLNCDFFFGDKVEHANIKQFDPTQLNGFKKYIHVAKTFRGFDWYTGISPIFSSKYTDFIISGQTNLLVNYLIIFYCKLTGKRYYTWAHGLRSVPTEWKVILMNKMLFTWADGIFTYGNYLHKYMKEFGIPEEKMHTIYNSLDSHKQIALYNKLKPSSIYKDHFGNDNPVVVFIGRIQKRMKLDMIIEAVNILRKKGKEVNIMFIGPYLDGEDLQQMVKDYGMEKNVWFYGPSYDEEENSTLLYNAAVCVVPGSIGLTSIHALSYGTPVISNDDFDNQMPEFEAIVDGDTGTFFKEGDVQSLADALDKWTGLPEKIRDKVRKSARKEIEAHWNVDSQIETFKKVLLSK